MTGSDAADGDDEAGDVDEDLDELQPVSTSLRTAQEQEGGTDRIVEREDGQAESDRDELDELAPVTSAVRTAQSQPDVAVGAGDDGDEECGGDD
jgi:hypothetical protein